MEPLGFSVNLISVLQLTSEVIRYLVAVKELIQRAYTPCHRSVITSEFIDEA